MIVDPDVALASDSQIEQTVTGEKIQHMIKKRNGGVNATLSFTVQVNGRRNLGFHGLSLDSRLPHDRFLLR
jgi:hypothetical protein